MSGVSAGNKLRNKLHKSPRMATLRHMRAMRSTLAELIRPLAERRTDKALASDGMPYRRRRLPSELAENSVEYWNDVWKAAQALRMKADQLARFAAQQAAAQRIRNHLASQPASQPANQPEEAPSGD